MPSPEIDEIIQSVQSTLSPFATNARQEIDREAKKFWLQYANDTTSTAGMQRAIQLARQTLNTNNPSRALRAFATEPPEVRIGAEYALAGVFVRDFGYRKGIPAGAFSGPVSRLLEATVAPEAADEIALHIENADLRAARDLYEKISDAATRACLWQLFYPCLVASSAELIIQKSPESKAKLWALEMDAIPSAAMGTVRDSVFAKKVSRQGFPPEAFRGNLTEAELHRVDELYRVVSTPVQSLIKKHPILTSAIIDAARYDRHSGKPASPVRIADDYVLTDRPLADRSTAFVLATAALAVVDLKGLHDYFAAASSLIPECPTVDNALMRPTMESAAAFRKRMSDLLDGSSRSKKLGELQNLAAIIIPFGEDGPEFSNITREYLS